MRMPSYPDLGIGHPAYDVDDAWEPQQLRRTPWWLEDALAWESDGALGDVGSPVSLSGTHHVDIAVVGGGYTGLWTALGILEREPTCRVAVLEQAVCGYGASGRNGGLVAGYWRYLPALTNRFGATAGRAIVDAGDRAQSAIRDVVSATDADVWWRETGQLKVSTVADDDDLVRASAMRYDEVGAGDQARLVEADALHALCSSPAFRVGVLFAEGASVQPARLARLLRAEVIERGGQVFESTEVRRLDVGPTCVLTTARGHVRANDVVLATNAALCGERRLRNRVMPFSSHIALSPPIPEVVEEHGWNDGPAILDTMMFPHYFRTTPDGRIAMGTGSGRLGRYGRLDPCLFSDDDATLRARRALARMFPASQGRVSYAWGGPIDVSNDRLPFFVSDAGGRVHFGVGYSGHGVNPSWIGGQTLAALALHREDEWTALPFARRRLGGFPPEPARTWGAAMIRRAIVNNQERLETGRRPRVIDLTIAAVPRTLRIPLGTR
jgi:glycine/D-amino acid oxidase-like deaminating enzyme